MLGLISQIDICESRTHRLDVRQLAKSASFNECSARESRVADAVDNEATRTVDDHQCCKAVATSKSCSTEVGRVYFISTSEEFCVCTRGAVEVSETGAGPNASRGRVSLVCIV